MADTTLQQVFQSTANAIRNKSGETAKLYPSSYSAAIGQLRMLSDTDSGTITTDYNSGGRTTIPAQNYIWSRRTKIEGVLNPFTTVNSGFVIGSLYETHVTVNETDSKKVNVLFPSSAYNNSQMQGPDDWIDMIPAYAHFGTIAGAQMAAGDRKVAGFGFSITPGTTGTVFRNDQKLVVFVDVVRYGSATGGGKPISYDTVEAEVSNFQLSGQMSGNNKYMVVSGTAHFNLEQFGMYYAPVRGTIDFTIRRGSMDLTANVEWYNSSTETWTADTNPWVVGYYSQSASAVTTGAFVTSAEFNMDIIHQVWSPAAKEAFGTSYMPFTLSPDKVKT